MINVRHKTATMILSFVNAYFSYYSNDINRVHNIKRNVTYVNNRALPYRDNRLSLLNLFSLFEDFSNLGQG